MPSPCCGARGGQEAQEAVGGVHRAVPGEARLEGGPGEGLRSGVQGRGQEEEGGGGAARRGGAAALRVPGAPGRSGHLGRPRRHPGARLGRQGRDDPPRDERRQPAGCRGPQLQGSLGRGARPRLSLALRARPAGARRDRDLQPIPLRGGAGGARPPREPRAPEAARGGEEGDIWKRRYRSINDWERHLTENGFRDRQALPEPLEGGAAQRACCGESTCRTTTGSSRRRTSASGSCGTTTRRRSPKCSPTRAPSGRRGT